MAKRKKTKDEFYLSNKDIFPELMRAKRLGRVTPELGAMFILIVEKYSSHPWFSAYSENWKTEFKSDAILALCKGALKFNENYAIENNKSQNPFAYFSSVVYRSFKSSRDREKKFSEASDKIPIGLF